MVSAIYQHIEVVSKDYTFSDRQTLESFEHVLSNDRFYYLMENYVQDSSALKQGGVR